MEGAEGLQRRREDIRHVGIQLGVSGTKMGSGAKSEPLASASLPSIPLGEESKVQKSSHYYTEHTGQLQGAGGWH